ncbi:MAG: hypothetical protein V4732_06615 [Pseudomonadota bacterium]
MSEPTIHLDSINEAFLKDYMPVAEFSVSNNIAEEKIIAMIREGSYSGRIKHGLWFVRRDQPKEKVVETLVVRPPSSNLVLKILRGSYGLGVTFWGWGACGGFLLASLLMIPIEGLGTDVFIVPSILLWFVYITVVFIGIWRSDKSFGVLSLASKLFVLVTFSGLAFFLLYAVALLTSDYPNH